MYGIDKSTLCNGGYWSGSSPSYKRHRYPPEIIAYAVWLYYRFALSFRDVEELLAAKGVIVSYEAIRLWCGKFGPEFAHKLRCRRRRLSRRWHVEMSQAECPCSVGNRSSYDWHRRSALAVVRNAAFTADC